MRTTDVLLETLASYGEIILAHKPQSWNAKDPAVAAWLQIYGLSGRVAEQIDVDNALAEACMAQLELEMARNNWIP